MFNQEPAEEQDQIPEAPGHEAEPQKKEGNTFKDHNLDFQNLKELKAQIFDYKIQKSEIEIQNLEFTNSNSELCSQVSYSEDQSSRCPHTPEGSRRSCCSEEGVHSVLQVDNGSEGDDSFLQREGSQRRSRRRFRRVNPRGEREVITDGQEPAGYNTDYVSNQAGLHVLASDWLRSKKMMSFLVGRCVCFLTHFTHTNSQERELRVEILVHSS